MTRERYPIAATNHHTTVGVAKLGAIFSKRLLRMKSRRNNTTITIFHHFMKAEINSPKLYLSRCNIILILKGKIWFPPLPFWIIVWMLSCYWNIHKFWYSTTYSFIFFLFSFKFPTFYVNWSRENDGVIIFSWPDRKCLLGPKLLYRRRNMLVPKYLTYLSSNPRENTRKKRGLNSRN